MRVPAIPENEEERIDTLQALDVLDTKPEERFDRLTRLARRLFNVPIALVNLIDEHREWPKSAQGIERSESPRDISFCGHTILGDDVLLVPDTRLDERFRDNPRVKDAPRIRFYAGCPVRAPNGSKLGTLCIIDREPRQLGEEEKALLRDLTRMVEQEIAAIQLATMDELTMLSNRRGFEALSRHALELSRRLKKPAAFLYFELDGSKQMNDQFGHAEGDHKLRSFAELLRHTFRESDVVGRLGGYEFAVLMTNASDTELDNAVERLEKAVDQHNKKAAQGYGIEFSFGKVTIDAAGHANVADLMVEANALMYKQKTSEDI
ncbi:MAG: sensor domain-containing diguanylate cyclase [Betaproteobacteria bacterium]|nr:MAG: sensor domain-containing diguanylate cyclase [Betaproteobacteria bacterium]